MRRQVLLADDDESVRKMVGRVLESEGYEVVTAGSGREAIGRFLGASPDLILLDLNMPDHDGWEAFDVIGQFAPGVPVIVITARPNQQERAIRAGVDGLMEKPLDLPLLLQTMDQLMSRSVKRQSVQLAGVPIAAGV